MGDSLFDAVFLFGLLFATVIRTWYGRRFRSGDVAHRERESFIVYACMALWGVALVLPLIAIYSPWLRFADYPLPSVLRLLGAIIFIPGLLLLWRSHADLADNFTPSLFIQRDHQLVTSGVYKYIRHPMYLSFWCWAVGQALLIDNWIAGPLGLLAFIPIYIQRVGREEAQLLTRFGDAYREYQRRTGAMFPRLRR